MSAPPTLDEAPGGMTPSSEEYTTIGYTCPITLVIGAAVFMGGNGYGISSVTGGSLAARKLTLESFAACHNGGHHRDGCAAPYAACGRRAAGAATTDANTAAAVITSTAATGFGKAAAHSNSERDTTATS